MIPPKSPLLRSLALLLTGAATLCGSASASTSLSYSFARMQYFAEIRQEDARELNEVFDGSLGENAFHSDDGKLSLWCSSAEICYGAFSANSGVEYVLNFAQDGRIGVTVSGDSAERLLRRMMWGRLESAFSPAVMDPTSGRLIEESRLVARGKRFATESGAIEVRCLRSERDGSHSCNLWIAGN